MRHCMLFSRMWSRPRFSRLPPTFFGVGLRPHETSGADAAVLASIRPKPWNGNPIGQGLLSRQ